MRVKICGITNYEDAMTAIEAGADALGFVFYSASPRYISPKDAANLLKKLPPFVQKVGLFVNEMPDEIEEISCKTGIDLAQIHFDVDENFIEKINFPVLPVVRAKSAEDLNRFNDRYRLIDAYCEAYGGSGKRLNLEWFEGVDCSRIILAGGLKPDNLAALKKFGFYGVDVSSGVELHKGKKDPMKVSRFVANAKTL